MRTISLFIIMLSVLLATENVLGVNIALMKAFEMVKRSMCGCYSMYDDPKTVSVCQNSINEFNKFLFDNGTTFSPLECNIKDKSLSGTATQGNFTTQGNTITQGNSTEAAESSSYKTSFIGILCVVGILVLGFGAYSWYLGKCPCIKSSFLFREQRVV